MLYQPSHLVNIGESLREREKLEAVQVFQLTRTVNPSVRVRPSNSLGDCLMVLDLSSELVWETSARPFEVFCCLRNLCAFKGSKSTISVQVVARLKTSWQPLKTVSHTVLTSDLSSEKVRGTFVKPFERFCYSVPHFVRVQGVEPWTFRVSVECSTNWAKRAQSELPGSHSTYKFQDCKISERCTVPVRNQSNALPTELNAHKLNKQNTQYGVLFL
jgi:hypothetical protein